MELITPNNKLFGLIYGQSGSGKTHLAATYCEMHPNDPVLLIDVDQGSATLNSPLLKGITDNLFVVSFDAFKDLNQVYALAKTNTPEAWIKAVPGMKDKLKSPFKAIIWDTWTEVQWVLSSELRRREGLLGNGLDYRKGIGIQHWGMMTDLNRLSIDAFKELPIDCLFLMQAATREDTVTGQIIKGPAIHGKLMMELPALFTSVIYTYNAPNGAFKATTQTKLGWPAKVRGIEGRDLENPRLRNLLK